MMCHTDACLLKSNPSARQLILVIYFGNHRKHPKCHSDTPIDSFILKGFIVGCYDKLNQALNGAF